MIKSKVDEIMYSEYLCKRIESVLDLICYSKCDIGKSFRCHKNHTICNNNNVIISNVLQFTTTVTLMAPKLLQELIKSNFCLVLNQISIKWVIAHLDYYLCVLWNIYNVFLLMRWDYIFWLLWSMIPENKKWPTLFYLYKKYYIYN